MQGASKVSSPHLKIRNTRGVFDWQPQSYQILKTVNFAATETQSPIKHKFFKAECLGFILANTRFSGEKHEDKSSSWQQTACIDFITVITQISPKSAKPFRAEDAIFGI